MNNPYECKHDNSRTVFKAYGDDKRYFRQCLDCGSKVLPWLKKAKVDRIWEVPTFDEELERRGRETAQAAFQAQREQREAELAQKDRDWWVWYNRYLQSEVWREKRRRVLERDDNTCQACLRRPATQVHHTTYIHVGHEPLFDLVSVCDICHEALHVDKREKAG